MYLLKQQKIKIVTATFFFLILFGYFRPFFINAKLNTREVMINSLLFFIWIGFSYVISNSFIENSRYDESITRI